MGGIRTIIGYPLKEIEKIKQGLDNIILIKSI